MKAFKYLIIYLLIIQLLLPGVVPLEFVYRYRIDYALVKDNSADIDVILDQIQRQIKKQDLQDYIIILGDSVAHSGPGPADQSVGARLQEYYRQQGRDRPVFNLAMPAMQVGDIYTMLLKLDEHGISTDNLIINVIYAGFAERNPGPSTVFWLQKDLARLDPASFDHIEAQLQASGSLPREEPAQKLNKLITQRLEVYRYKDFIKADLQKRMGTNRKAENGLGDPRPWYEKEGLKKLLDTPDYHNAFAVKPFDMSSRNPQIYFLNKIIEHQRHKETLVFMAAVNPELMPQVNQPGYQANLQAVRNYFAAHSVRYIDFHGSIDQRRFSDHVHLIGPGYSLVARRLGEDFSAGEKQL